MFPGRSLESKKLLYQKLCQGLETFGSGFVMGFGNKFLNAGIGKLSDLKEVYDSKLSIFILKTNNYGVQPQPWYVEIYSMQSGSVGTKLATISNINPTETTMSIKIYDGVLYSNIATAIKKHVGFTSQVSTVYKVPAGLGGVWGFCFSVPVDIPEEVFVTKNALGGVKTFSGAFMRFRDDKGLVLMSGYEQPYKSCYGIDSVEGKYIISLDLVTKTLFIR
jgi:hypothetical protein